MNLSNSKKAQAYMPIVAQIAAASAGVRVVFSRTATTASINNADVITLPSSLIDANDEDDVILMRGFICHEGAGHKRQTDNDVWDEFCMSTTLLGARLLNIIEDVRIERGTWKIFKGAKSILNELIEALTRRKPEFFFPKDPVVAAKIAQDSPALLLRGFLLTSMRAKELGQPVEYQLAEQLMLTTFGAELTGKLYALAVDGANGNSTADCVRATKAILKLLEDSQQDEKKDDSGQPDEAGDPDDSGQPDEAGKPDDSGQPDGAGDTPSGKIAKAIKGALSDADIPSSDLGDAIKDAAGNFDANSPVNRGKGCSDIYDGTTSLTQTLPPKAVEPATRSASLKLGLHLEALLQAKVDENDYLERSGKLVGSKLARTRLLDVTVFEREDDETEGLDTSLFFMLDESWSMENGSGKTTVDCMTAIGDALSKFDIPFGMAFFNTTLKVAKPFGEVWRKASGRLSLYKESGGTPAAAAIVHAVGELAARPEKRRIAFLITDGAVAHDTVERSVKTALEANIETRCVIINQREKDEGLQLMDSMKKTGMTEVSLANSFDEVPEAVWKALKTSFQ